MEQSPEYYDGKWQDVIKQMPRGGEYRFDQRKNGYNIIASHIGKNQRVFDYACGLGVIDKMLEDQGCFVAGCDYSKVAVDYVNKHVTGDFKTGDKIWGEHDYIIACYFLEHITNPVEWLTECLKHAPSVICSIPNNFNKTGEHSDMQWECWDDFNELFKEFTVTRLDYDKWERGTNRAWQHPTFEFK